MLLYLVFVTAVCVLFLTKLKRSKKKSICEMVNKWNGEKKSQQKTEMKNKLQYQNFSRIFNYKYKKKAKY